MPKPRHERGFTEVPNVVPHTPEAQKAFIALLCLVILVLLGAVGYLFKTSHKLESSNPGLAFPVDPTSSSVSSVYLSYEYRATITNVKNDKQNLILTTDIKEDAPDFIVDSQTKVYIFSKGNEVPASPGVIRVGDKVVLFENYDLSSKTWKLIKVDIISDTAVPTVIATPPPLNKTKPKASSSPSAKPAAVSTPSP
jgi:hypothetical protein